MSIMRIRATISGGQGLPGVFTLYANGSTTTPSTPDAADVCARVRVFTDAIKAYFHSSTTWQVQGQVDLLDPANASLVGSLSVTAPAVVTGTGSTRLPPASAVLLQHNTGVIVAGRRQKGRSFISPLADAINSGGVPLAAAVTIIQNAANVMLTGTTSSVPVVWHRPLPLGIGGGFATAVTGFTVAPYFAVLRSRRD